MNKINDIKFSLEKHKLIAMLRKMNTHNVFPNIIGSVEDWKIISKQSYEKSLYRILVFKSSYFKEIQGCGTFIINAKDILKDINNFFNNESKNEILDVKINEQEILISNKDNTLDFPLIKDYQKHPDAPINFVGGIPIIQHKLKLDNHFRVDLASIKQSMKLLKNERFMSFVIKDGILRIVLWYEKDTSRYVRTPYVYHNISSEDLIITFDGEIKKIIQQLKNKTIDIYTSKTGGPVWFAEETDDFAFGIMTTSLDAEPNIEDLTF